MLVHAEGADELLADSKLFVFTFRKITYWLMWC